MRVHRAWGLIHQLPQSPRGTYRHNISMYKRRNVDRIPPTPPDINSKPRQQAGWLTDNSASLTVKNRLEVPTNTIRRQRVQPHLVLDGLGFQEVPPQPARSIPTVHNHVTSRLSASPVVAPPPHRVLVPSPSATLRGQQLARGREADHHLFPSVHRIQLHH